MEGVFGAREVAMSRAQPAVCLVLFLGLLSPAYAASAGSVIEKARAAIERGDVDPARDLAPLVATLRTARGGGREALIDAIEELGQYDGPSPAIVKSYLQREAPPVLIEIAQGKADWTVRGDALMALRSLNASDEFLDRASAVAQADATKEAGFIRSRGQLLQSWKQSRPQPAVSDAMVQPKDAARERRALAFLKQRGLNVSVAQLHSSAMEGHADEVEALLDAGVSPGAHGRAGSVLSMATWTGCATSPGALEGRLKTVRLLLDRGADVQEKDELDNTILLTAAQHCPLPVVQLLVEAGAPVNTANRGGHAPLAAAFLGNQWDVAAYLVEKGARLKKSQIDSVFFELPTDSHKLALIRRATAK
jgi:uncharacterized protein